ncbi:uncharacterized protein [Montipora foliosa]|uniref:uncharacterized protein isoform X1 n=1 Tax=Montipora foliosa TaxID=591990 RepID=UPI0035F1CAF4
MKNIICLVAVFGIACLGVFSPDERCYDWNLVCSCRGGNAQRKNDCDTLSTVTFRDCYLPTGLVREGNNFHSPYCVNHSNKPVLCMVKARAGGWLKDEAKSCEKGMCSTRSRMV